MYKDAFQLIVTWATFAQKILQTVSLIHGLGIAHYSKIPRACHHLIMRTQSLRLFVESFVKHFAPSLFRLNFKTSDDLRGIYDEG